MKRTIVSDGRTRPSPPQKDIYRNRWGPDAWDPIHCAYRKPQRRRFLGSVPDEEFYESEILWGYPPRGRKPK